MSIQGVNSTLSGRQDITRMLEKMRELSQQNQATEQTSNAPINNEKTFAGALDDVQQVINKVNDLQNDSASLKDAYINGNTSVSLSQVVVAAQKSDLAFQGLIAVRNKLVEAYKDVMNMPI